MSFIKRLPGRLHSSPEEGVADGFLGNKVHWSVKQCFQSGSKVEETICVITGGLAVHEANQKVQVALLRVKRAGGRRPKEGQILDAELVAKLHQLRALSLHQIYHNNYQI